MSDYRIVKIQLEQCWCRAVGDIHPSHITLEWGDLVTIQQRTGDVVTTAPNIKRGDIINLPNLQYTHKVIRVLKTGDPVTCVLCGGDEYVSEETAHHFGGSAGDTTCPSCSGTGKTTWLPLRPAQWRVDVERNSHWEIFFEGTKDECEARYEQLTHTPVRLLARDGRFTWLWKAKDRAGREDKIEGII